jgi:hypothetical protein
MWHGELPVAMFIACQTAAPWGPSFQLAGLEVPLVALWPVAALAALTVALYLTRDAAAARRDVSRERAGGRR